MRGGEIIWTPPTTARHDSTMGRYMDWLASERGISVTEYADLWRWSIGDIAAFWTTIWEFFEITPDPPGRALDGTQMPDVHWFPEARLNYAAHALRTSGDGVAVAAISQTRERVVLSWDALRDQVARARQAFADLGVGVGDRVAAYLPNVPEAIIAYLATASLGATWSSCAPEFGARGVIDRFSQISPAILLVVDGYRYGDKRIDRQHEVAAMRSEIASIDTVVTVPYLDPEGVLPGTLDWRELLTTPGTLDFEPLGFDHPLAILYSSGTTGLPKPIVHGHGGMLLEHLKHLGLQFDVRPGDRFFWMSTTGWVMWNIVVSSLLNGATAVLFDGNPNHPDSLALWRLVEQERLTQFGVGAGFILGSRRAGVVPRDGIDLASLRWIGSTGSPLPVEGYEWVHGSVSPDVPVIAGSGGTDVASGFVGGAPIVPVYAGEMSCPALGVDVAAYDEEGTAVVGVEGELVVRQPMPSMPVRFWGDDGSRLGESYFTQYPGVWHHGDRVTFTPHLSSVISGRSDSTLNRGGVRLGTSEFYSVVEELPGVIDSLVVHHDHGGTDQGRLVLFVVLAESLRLTDEMRSSITHALKSQLSPRHVPDDVIAISGVPRTLSGKKLEVPVKRLLEGQPAASVVNLAAVSNPEAFDDLVAIAAQVAGS